MNSKIINGAGEVKYQWNSLNIYEVIEFIHWRPGFTIGHETIDNVWLYLRAYQDALASTDLLDYGVPDFSHFSTWMCGISNNRALAAGWNYHILRKARRSQYKAYELFFQFIEEYKASTISAEEVVLTDKNRETAQSSGITRTVVYPVDEKVVTLEKSVKRIIIFQIGNSTARWNVFLDEQYSVINSSFIDKASEIYRQIKQEFNVERKSLRKLTSDQSIELYKICYKGKYRGSALSITRTTIK